MSLLNQETKDQLTNHFNTIKKPVNMLLFVNDCDSCEETKSLLAEVSELNENIKLSVLDLDSESAKIFDITQAPVIMFIDEKGDDLRIRFKGIPAGHEFSAFITILMEIGGDGEPLPEDFVSRVNSIDKPVDIKVFVTLSCPHCSGAVTKAHKLALMNPNIRAEMIECGAFPELSEQYNVASVPKIVINETSELIGNQPITVFLDTIDKL